MSAINLEQYGSRVLIPHQRLTFDFGRLGEVARGLYTIFTDPEQRQRLKERGLESEITEYDGWYPETIHDKIRRVGFGRAIVVNEEQVVCGAVKFSSTPVRELRLPVPPRFAFGPLVAKPRETGTHFKAWTTGEAGVLADACRDMIDRGVKCTTEPLDSPPEIFAELEDAGLKPVAEGWFDTGSNKGSVPVRSVLFLA